MRKAEVYQQALLAGVLEEMDRSHYRFSYVPRYIGEPVSLTMPIREQPHEYDRFPPVFEGLLPEGVQLEALLRRCKLDATDYFSQLLVVGEDVVGSLTVKEIK